LRRSLRGTEYLDLGRNQVVDDAGHERHLGSYHHEADLILGAESHDGGVVGHVERHAGRDLGDPRVARRAVEPGQ